MKWLLQQQFALHYLEILDSADTGQSLTQVLQQALLRYQKMGRLSFFLYRERRMIIAIESNESGYWGLYWKRNRQGDRKPTAQHFFAKKDGTGLR